MILLKLMFEWSAFTSAHHLPSPPPNAKKFDFGEYY